MGHRASPPGSGLATKVLKLTVAGEVHPLPVFKKSGNTRLRGLKKVFKSENFIELSIMMEQASAMQHWASKM